MNRPLSEAQLVVARPLLPVIEAMPAPLREIAEPARQPHRLGPLDEAEPAQAAVAQEDRH